jgi:hypothetical protein
MANRRALEALLVITIFVLAVVGLIYTLPVSKIRVLVANGYYGQIGIRVYVDGDLKADMDLGPGWEEYQVVGMWSVSQGSHSVSIERGYWYLDTSGQTDVFRYVDMDGKIDFVNTCHVGPLSIKNVWFDLWY